MPAYGRSAHGARLDFRIEQIDSKSNTFTPLVQHYVGFLSRLVHGINEPDPHEIIFPLFETITTKKHVLHC